MIMYALCSRLKGKNKIKFCNTRENKTRYYILVCVNLKIIKTVVSASAITSHFIRIHDLQILE